MKLIYLFFYIPVSIKLLFFSFLLLRFLFFFHFFNFNFYFPFLLLLPLILNFLSLVFFVLPPRFPFAADMSNTFCIPYISSAKEIKELVQNFAYRAGLHRRNGATSSIADMEWLYIARLFQWGGRRSFNCPKVHYYLPSKRLEGREIAPDSTLFVELE
jgi:hypothetical protein